MTTTAKYVSAYDRKVALIKDTLKAHSKLSDRASFELAELVLDALNHIPEKVR
ncbi:DUF6307 family protein [Actinocrispum sp. NPDC049592]|uniref:DUF6307 family protein n=1 Tax=Actinocrispum sp. NPDC049592 TaxID=3154835 RepID=UPI0034485BC4